MKRLSTDHIKQIHSLVIEEIGGLDGIRDQGLLESAANLPFQTFDGEPLYKTIESKAAILGYTLIKNHAFLDGNKRTGMLTMLLFLELNGSERVCTDEEIINVGTALANGSMDEKDLLDWILKSN